MKQYFTTEDCNVSSAWRAQVRTSNFSQNQGEKEFWKKFKFLMQVLQDDYSFQSQVVNDCFISTAKDSSTKKPKQLAEYTNTNRDLMVSILYFHHFFTHGESFIRQYSLWLCNLIRKDKFLCSVRWLCELMHTPNLEANWLKRSKGASAHFQLSITSLAWSQESTI